MLADNASLDTLRSVARGVGHGVRASAACVLILTSVLGACAAGPDPKLPDTIIDTRARVVEARSGGQGSAEPYVGILRAWDPGSVILETASGELRSIQLSPRAKLEISRGVQPNAGKGARIGSIVGVVGGALFGAASSCSDESGIIEFSARECALMGGLIGGTAGALVGLIVGSQFRTERWTEISSTNRTPPTDAPQALSPPSASRAAAP